MRTFAFIPISIAFFCYGPAVAQSKFPEAPLFEAVLQKLPNLQTIAAVHALEEYKKTAEFYDSASLALNEEVENQIAQQEFKLISLSGGKTATPPVMYSVCDRIMGRGLRCAGTVADEPYRWRLTSLQPYPPPGPMSLIIQNADPDLTFMGAYVANDILIKSSALLKRRGSRLNGSVLREGTYLFAFFRSKSGWKYRKFVWIFSAHPIAAHLNTKSP